MSLRRLTAVARKESLHVLRDPRSLGLSLAMPVVLLLLFGYALKMDVENIPLRIWDQSRTPASRDLAALFAASRYFDLRGYAEGYAELEAAIASGEALMGLVIPLEYARDVAAGRPAAIQALLDGSDPNTADIARHYATALAARAAAEVAVIQARPAGPRPAPQRLDVRPRVWFNTDLESRHFIIPGLIAVILAVIAALLTSLTVAREWETGAMEQLISTPLRPAELILGKLLPYFAIGMADVLIAVLMGEFLFGVPLRGSVFLLLGVSALFVVSALSLGLAISVIARTQLLANQLAFLTTFLPAFLLSGFAFPIANMPAPIQLITYLTPARYFVTAARSIYLKGLGPSFLWLEMLLLAAFAAALLTFALRKFVKRLA